MRHLASQALARRAPGIALVLALAAPFAVAVTSCSLIGYQIGASIDDSREYWHAPRVVPGGQGLMIRRGAPLAVHTHDSTIVSGRYLGLGEVAADRYAPRYDAWREHGAVDLPALDEIVTISVTSRGMLQGAFEGFGNGTLLLSGRRDGRVERFAIGDIHSLVRADGRALTTNELLAAAADSSKPSRDALQIVQGDWRKVVIGDSGHGIQEDGRPRWPTTTVGVDDVSHVALPFDSHMADRLLVAGVLVDGTILVGLAMMASWRGPFDNAGGGCDGSALGGMYTLTSAPFDRVAGTFVSERDAVAAVAR